MGMFSGNALAHLVMQSDAISKLVLLILCGMSVMCWSIFFQKYIILRMKQKQLRHIRKALASLKTIDQVVLLEATYQNTFGGQFLTPATHQLKQLVHHVTSTAASAEQELDYLAMNLLHIQDELARQESSGVSLLATAVEASPLLGLFGTVWGLIHSFIRISERQSADIVTVAPGIAEALITTLVGLIVAIPAVVLYHVLVVMVRNCEQELSVITERFEMIARKNILERCSNDSFRTVSPKAESSGHAAGNPHSAY